MAVSPPERAADPGELVWITNNAFVRPTAPEGWMTQRFTLPAELAEWSPPGRYAVILEANCNESSEFDPVLVAHAVRTAARRDPEVVIAITTWNREVPAASQHAIAEEAGMALGVKARIVSAQRIAPAPSESKDSPRKAREPRHVNDWNGALAEAVAALADSTDNALPTVDPDAAAFVYAFSSARRARDPYRFSPVGRRIVEAIASGQTVPTTADIAQAVYATPKTVGRTITEIVDEMSPDTPHGVSRDRLARLLFMMHQFGPWVRLRASRSDS